MLTKLPKVTLSVLFSFLFLFLSTNTSFAAYTGLQNAASDPDLNIRLRGWVSSSLISGADTTPGILNNWHFGSIAEVDPKAPQLDGLFGINPSITGLDQLREYDGKQTIPVTRTDNWGSTLMAASPINGDVIVPEAGYDIGGGYVATIDYLDASNGDVTINYTAGQSDPATSPITIGYTIHFLGITSINPVLIAKYNEALSQNKMVTLPCGYSLGTSNSVMLSIRDSGTFFDVRSGYDWWQRQGPKDRPIGAPTPINCNPTLEPQLIDPGSGASSSIITTVPGGPIPEPYVRCNEVRPDFTHLQSEFHSLRPYQASPCQLKPVQTVTFCGNDFYAKETYELNPGDFGSECFAKDADGTLTCNFPSWSSSMEADIRLDPAELPILGNTELVANSINRVSQLDFTARMNNYVSWYLNGAIYRAEEVVPTIKDVLTFAGPVRKLLPYLVQQTIREDQIEQAGVTRHYQVTDCSILGIQVPCYEPGIISDFERIQEPPKNQNYQPLSSTEDRTGEVNALLKETETDFGGQTIGTVEVQWVPSANNPRGVDDIYFAHTEETAQLAKYLQGTFGSKSTEGFKEDSDENLNLIKNVTAFCDPRNYRTNPGDDLFGDYNNKEEGYLEKISGNFTYKTKPFTQDFAPHVNFVDSNCQDKDTCETYVSYRPVKRYAYVALQVFTHSPKITEIWKRLVDGQQGITKRFFPKDLVKQFKDIPGQTQAIYDTFISSATRGVGTEAIAGSPYVNRGGDDARLFIPHLGSVQDYFLQGIQCALRPQGMCGSQDLKTASKSASLTPTACSQGTPNTVPDEVKALMGQGLSPLDAAYTHAGTTFDVPVCVLKAISGIETGLIGYQGSEPKVIKNTINWSSVVSAPAATQERYMWQGNTELMCDEATGDEFAHNQCSARGPMQITTGDAGVYCRDVEPKCTYKDPDHCTYSCDSYCTDGGVVPGAAPNAWSGDYNVQVASARTGASPTNLYDAIMGAAMLLQLKVGPNDNTWTDAQMNTAGLTYYGDAKSHSSLGGRTYGQAIIDYCHGNFPVLFP